MPKLKRTLILALIVGLLPLGYLLSGPYLDRRAIRKANEFCSLIVVGETFGALSARAEAHSVHLEQWPPRPGGEERYIARFSGFLANAVQCEISIARKQVTAKFVEMEFW